MMRPKTFALLSGGLLLTGAALIAQEIPDRPEKIQAPTLVFPSPRVEAFRSTLHNGIPVYVASSPQGMPVVHLTLHLRGGSYLDPKGKEGLAGLLGNLLASGGAVGLPAEALDERLEFLAGTLNGRIDETGGTLTLAILEKDLKEGLDLFMRVLTRPAFQQDRLEQLKEDALQGLQARNDELASLARMELPGLLNGRNHFTSALPTKASLSAITRKDLRALHGRLLHPGNLVVSVSGRFGREALLAALEPTLGTLKAGPRAVLSPAPPAPAFQRKAGIYVIDKDVSQGLLAFTLPGLRRSDADWHAVLVMNQILGGGGFTSRLLKRIRSDEGLTYGVETQFEDCPYWRGNWGGSLQTKNQSVAYALRLVLEEMDRLKTTLVPAEELATIKDGMILAYPAQWGQKRRAAEALAEEETLGWPRDGWYDYRERIQAVTAEDVQRVARGCLDPRKLVVLVVGRAAEVEAGDPANHPGLLKDAVPLPLVRLPLRDPLTLRTRR